MLKLGNWYKTDRLTLGAVILSVLVLVIFFLVTSSPNLQESKHREKVGILVEGAPGEIEWNDMRVQEIQQAADSLGLPTDTQYVTRNEKDCREDLQRLLDEDCTIIVSTSSSFEPIVREYATKYSHIQFLQSAWGEGTGNLTCYDGRNYQAAYLAGLVAGMNTKGNAVGYLGSVATPAVTNAINAFTIGVERVNPRAKVYVAYAQAWDDDSKARTAVEKMLKLHPEIDILANDYDTPEPLEIAREHGIAAIGCYQQDDSYRDVLLTSITWNWYEFYAAVIKEVHDGRFVNRDILWGLSEGVVDLQPLSSRCVPGTEEVVAREKTALVKQEKDVFDGPIYDNEGKLRVSAGDVVPDDVLRGKMLWYVKGVEVL